uniref:NADH-ubiquinone oxidoreductase chain 4L n=1 Tax=Darthula hardwickii TaxID=1264638 RepID=A0A0U1Z5Q3_9HEMI|nr:NADH dehydrogenase subunit 4L [Darthula hardwickii]AJP09356.1 NADH dehydrogenase subunit 4L [Darthula hardwickii]
MINLILLMVMFGFFNFIFIRKHMLMCLISLEFIIVYLLMFIYMNFMIYSSSMYIYLFMICMYVCEGSFGLSLIVLMIRCYSNDYLNSLFMW